MIYTDKELAQLAIVYCKVYAVEHVVISPGSRNAPLIVGFVNDPHFKTYTVVDERSAAFFGLGIAQQTGKPVALVCTSGSALLNYYPAIAEAYYSNIPLVVISADRPKHLIDIGDGQTIRQENVFSNHILYSANLTAGRANVNANEKLLKEALSSAVYQMGPVHINVPFDEPLYNTTDSLKVSIPEGPEKTATMDLEIDSFAETWNSASKKMILLGSNPPDRLLENQLAVLAQDESVLVLTETTSNVHYPEFISNIDQLIFPLKDDELKKFRPELLVTLGGMIVSKKIKQVLRNHQPDHHWHVDLKTGLDTYHCLTDHIKTAPADFFKDLIKVTQTTASDYKKYWLNLRNIRKSRHKEYAEGVPFSDFRVFDLLLKSIPRNSMLQMGNSSVIRYHQLFDSSPSLKVFCNRGTSGIDGSTSTAIGAACCTTRQTVLITGDISFFYDSNALWNNYLKTDLRIIVINNGGGGIFRFIPGPQSTNALSYFEAPHTLNARNLCEMFDISYQDASGEAELKEALDGFYKGSGRAKLLEIFTPRELNDKILKDYFKFL